MFCIATGRDKSAEALAAFVIFAAVVLLNMVFDRRPGVITGEGKGIDFGGGGG